MAAKMLNWTEFDIEVTLRCKLLKTQGEIVWLGGRDSNPDNLLQRQMSYRWTTSQYQRGPRCGNFRL